MDERWFLIYVEKEFEKPKGLIPFMAVIKKNKEKVHPVLDSYGLLWIHTQQM